MECEKAGGLMMKYMDGVLTDAEAISLNRHIKTCGHCKEDFLAYDGIMKDFSEMTLSEAPEGFEYRVMEIITRLPETRPKAAGRPLTGVFGIYTVLLSLGFILNVNKEAIIEWMYNYPQFEPLLNIIVPISTAINSISFQVSAAVLQGLSYLEQAGGSLHYILLLLFGVFAAAQLVIYKRERTVAEK